MRGRNFYHASHAEICIPPSLLHLGLVRGAGSSFLTCFSRNRRRNRLCIYVFVFSPLKGSQPAAHFYLDTWQQLGGVCPLPGCLCSPYLSCSGSFLWDVVIPHLPVSSFGGNELVYVATGLPQTTAE